MPLFKAEKNTSSPSFKIRYFKTTHTITLSLKNCVCVCGGWHLSSCLWIRTDFSVNIHGYDLIRKEARYFTVPGIMPSFTSSRRNKREVGRKVPTYLDCLPAWEKLELGCFEAPTPESKCRSKGTPFFHAWLQKQPGAGLPELWLLLWMKRRSKNRKS